MFRVIKQFGQAMRPSAIKQGLAAGRESFAGGPAPEQIAALPPEQRRAYEDAIARANAAAEKLIADQRASRVLLGPAGDHLYGPLPTAAELTRMDVAHEVSRAAKGVADALRETVKGRSAPPPPRPPVSSDRATQEAHERAERERARAPYLAPGRNPVIVTRVPTERSNPIAGLAAWLGTSGLAVRPDLVYGVARVPDHLPGGIGLGRAAIIEWEVVHSATEAHPPASPADVTEFDARERWVSRRPGEPSLLDEDLGLAYLQEAGIGPERCLGIARRIGVDARSGGDESTVEARVLVGVTGLAVLQPPGTAGETAARMGEVRPLSFTPPAEVCTEVLNWGAVRAAVMPRTDKRPAIPSPFPYLPATPQELLQAYLEVVGIAPHDCYSAQVTQDETENLVGRTAHMTTTNADQEVAADGTMRRRFRGGDRVVVVYRDRPAYAAGRERWATYQREVLQAQLHVGVGLRAPLPAQSALERGALGSLQRGIDTVVDLVTGYGWDTSDFAPIPHFRYCWPPAD